MKAALLLAVAALAAAAPLAAQESAAPPPPHPPAAPPTPEADPPPGPIMLVTASQSVIASGRAAPGPWQPAGSDALDEPLCLSAGEEALFASDRVAFHLVGEGCFIVPRGEQAAYDDEQRAHHLHLLEQAQIAHGEAIAGGDPAVIAEAHTRLQDTQRKAAERGVHPAPPMATRGLRTAAAPAAPTRTRTGAVRGDGDPAPAPAAARPIIFRLASASPAVLQRYPRGTLVQKTTALCLNRGEEATIVGSNGQSVSYSGPGCLHRRAKPTGTNVGGFTFG